MVKKREGESSGGAAAALTLPPHTTKMPVILNEASAK